MSTDSAEIIDRAIRIMAAQGGSFVRRLAEAYLYADPDNQLRLQSAFPEYFARYIEQAAREAAEPDRNASVAEPLRTIVNSIGPGGTIVVEDTMTGQTVRA